MPAYRKLPSGLWQATIRTPVGRRTKTDPHKAVVRKWAEEGEASLRRGEFTDPRDGKLTLGEWWGKWSAARDVELATERREESHWRVHIEPRWGKVQLAQVTAWDVEAWATELSKAGVGATTRNQVLRLLRMLLAEATRHRLIPADPTSGVKMPKIPKHVDRILSRREWEILDEALEGDPMVRCMLMAGLRWAEAAGLHAHRVDPGRGTLEVVETIRRDQTIKPYPKSAAGRRTLHVGPILMASLSPLLESGGLLFAEPGGKPLDYSNWRRRTWVPALKLAKLADPQPTPHDLRHTFGSWLAEAGVPPHKIRDLMGHGSIRATERYLHAGDEWNLRAIEAIGS